MKNIYKALFLSALIIIPLTIFGQTTINSQEICLYKSERDDCLKLPIESEKRGPEFDNDLVIPIVFHLIKTPGNRYISDQEIVKQLERLNLDFAGMNSDIYLLPLLFDSVKSTIPIRFCLASVDVEGRSTTGIIRSRNDNDRIGLSEDLFYATRGGQSAWDTDEYLNIWVTSFGEGSGLAGFANGIHQNVANEKKGVVISSNYFVGSPSSRFSKGRTLVHEIGHFLGLEHLWGNGGCEANDFVDDTPVQISPYNHCPVHPMISCNSEDMFMNFMDYVDDDCMLFFTKKQKERMLNVLSVFGPDLLQSCTICHDTSIGFEQTLTFKLYPNPNEGDRFYIEFPLETVEFSIVEQIRIFNTSGELFYREEHLIYSEIAITLNSLFTPGMYFVVIGDVTSKLIIL